MTDSPLGRKSNYPDRYDPSLIVGLNRADSRQNLRLDNNQIGKFGIYSWIIGSKLYFFK